ncbi:CPBP family intramembrane glutamic endopeptidase [Brachybacterium sp. GCM10030267]|uniref:CPBP family intramembrane glutamic endopeptidase n=1 Tax=Brachybacterium sp. GCM10030267 TaxID=3273381 RepID=UPI00360ADEFF
MTEIAGARPSPVAEHSRPAVPDPSPVPSAASDPAVSEQVAFHRLPRVVRHRRYWWRPLLALLVTAASFAAMGLLLAVPVVAVSLIWPGAAPSEMISDPLNPMDQVLGLGALALLIPAVLLGTRVAYGRFGIAHSVLGRFRWGLLGRAALVVVPVYLLTGTAANLVLNRDGIALPPPTAGVLAAWLLALVLAPLQSAGEEYAFRVLPLQVLGTWLRWPVIGILAPVPLFVLGHGYTGLGRVEIALFAVVMGLLAWKTGGIEIPVLLHVANNWTLFVIAPMIPGFTEQGEVSLPSMLLSAVPMLVLAAALWWWFSRREGLGLWQPQRVALGHGALPARLTRPARDSVNRGQSHPAADGGAV